MSGKIVARLGMIVSGEISGGPIIAMTKEWCIYQSPDGEVAEQWDTIMVDPVPPTEASTQLEEKVLEDES